MAPPLDTVWFLSDYGLDDEFVGVVKGVVKSIAPQVTVVDLTHQIPPYDIRAGSLALARSMQYLAPGVVLAVVDPGVGSARRAVAVEVGSDDVTAFLVGPDNGLLAPAVAMVGGARRAVSLTNDDYHLAAPGPTFAGRDVMAPAAAHLCAGLELDLLGEPVDPLSLLPGHHPPQPPGGRQARWARSSGSTASATPSSTSTPTRSPASRARCWSGRATRPGWRPGWPASPSSSRARSGSWSTPTACWRWSSTSARPPTSSASTPAAPSPSRPRPATAPSTVAPMRPGTTIVLAVVLVAILGAALIQFLVIGI